MNISVYSYSDKGDRQNNEDVLSTQLSGNEFFAVIADGLGGYQAGEIASQYTVSEILRETKENPCTVESLLKLIQTINEQIRLKQRKFGNMMSTVAILWINPDESTATVINVGDTRIYQFRNEKIVFQSIDHSIAQMAVLAGNIKKSDIRSYPGRNRLIRAIGADEFVKSECITLDIASGDSFLLCTDGFWEIITEDIMINSLDGCRNAEEWLLKMKMIIDTETSKNKDNNSAIAIII